MSEIRRFEDISDEVYLFGEEIDIDDVFGKEIIVLGIHEGTSKYNGLPITKILFKMDGTEYITWSQSGNIMRQLAKAKREDKIPFITTPRKNGRSHTLT